LESCADSNNIFVRGTWDKIWRAASSPLIFGIAMSNSATSGFSESTISTASSPSIASPTTDQLI